MNVLDLFSGIGGFSLGLERAGMQTVAFCEIDPYCQAVLRKHWPNVPIWGDVRTLTNDFDFMAHTARNDVAWRRYSSSNQQDAIGLPPDTKIDVICGGFPCQDISVAGKGAGIEGERSGLWSEFARIIGEVRPRYVIVENVSALLGRGIERVLGDLAALGYDAEWHCIPASALGAPHRRDRVWIVAYASSVGLERPRNVSRPMADAQTRQSLLGCESLANTGGDGLPQRHVNGESSSPPDRIFSRGELERALAEAGGEQWLAEPDVGRVAHGVPARVDRLRALGNAIVPQIAEIIGKAIMSHSEFF